MHFPLDFYHKVAADRKPELIPNCPSWFTLFVFLEILSDLNETIPGPVTVYMVSTRYLFLISMLIKGPLHILHYKVLEFQGPMGPSKF